MNNIFNFFSINGGLAFGSALSVYKPYINYTWQMLPNAKVKNSGTSGVDLQLYSGNPLDFQRSQYISGVQIVDDIDGVFSISFSVSYDNVSTTQALLSSSKLSILLIGGYIKISATDSIPAWATLTPLISPNKLYNITLTSNGSVLYTYLDNILVSETLCTAPITLNNTYTISAWTTGTTYYLDGQLDYLTISDRVLTAEEIALSNSNPNAFYEAMVNDANTLFCTDFRGTAEYIADSKNYSEGRQLFINPDFTIDLNGWAGTSFLSWNNGGCSFNSARNDSLYQYNTSVGKIYKCIFKIRSITTGSIKCTFGPSTMSASVTSEGEYTFIGKCKHYTQPDGYASYLNISGTGTDAIIEYAFAYEVSGVYPITNYSATQRTNFKQEPTGLQDLTRSFDSLGFYTGVTDYLNCNGVGYGDTGWIPSADEDWTLEAVIDTGDLSSDKRFGVYYNSKAIAMIRVATNGYIYEYIFNGVKGVNMGSNKLAHICMVFSPSGEYRKYYADTQLIGTDPLATHPSEEPFYIGTVNGQSGYEYNSNIHLFKVHNKVLTQEEITTNYNNYVTQGLI